MNALLPRFLKSMYRKEPISSFIVIVGLVDAAIGGVGGRWTLLGFGASAIALGILVRWLQSQKIQTAPIEERARRYLPPSSSPSPLPPLTSKKKRRSSY
ncbi:hypothetical protein IQ249_14100 [Lusitaniella coriacea LEGE 07157]|uniref:Uncharacterized protein n=1 Tax=Lusitaniella coriacea LEGE 07157 TaxID=945747 RepID=A0A8J7E0H7_9CYAN|nr:hypothetical protein [Lusitaniella coriacea]MBE9117029.1 hypothetical protein [Lusitaniella coriacea LEGE 07157]